MKNEYKKEQAIEYFYIPKWEEIPNISLYLDQAVTLLEDYLKPFTLDPEEKVITKTMINNYVKQNIIKTPVNKKYNKDHIGTLFVICILKQVYSINDISNLIKLSFKNNAPQEAYNKFTRALEKSIKEIFHNEKDNKDIELSKDQYILKYVVQSFASKLYVEKEYLFNKRESKKENPKNKKTD